MHPARDSVAIQSSHSRRQRGSAALLTSDRTKQRSPAHHRCERATAREPRARAKRSEARDVVASACGNRRRLRDARLLGIDDIGPELGVFDTVVLFGNNIGLLGGPRKAPRLLRKLQGVTRPDARMLCTSIFLYDTDDPSHLAYHERNRRRG